MRALWCGGGGGGGGYVQLLQDFWHCLAMLRNEQSELLAYIVHWLSGRAFRQFELAVEFEKEKWGSNMAFRTSETSFVEGTSVEQTSCSKFYK